MLPQIEKRYANPNRIQIDLKQRIRRVYSTPEVNGCAVTSTPAKAEQCYACVQDLLGTNMYEEGRRKLNTRVKTSCSICNALICKQYTQVVCRKCNNRWKYFFRKPIKSLIYGNDKTDVQMRKYILEQLIFICDLLVTNFICWHFTMQENSFLLFTVKKMLTSSISWCQQEIILT